jgi:hypothetical protein
MTITPSLCTPLIRETRHSRAKSLALKASASCGAEQPTGSLLREREIAANSTLVFDSCRSRYPSHLSKSAQVQLPKNAEISGDYKFRTKTAKYRALEKNARRERISELSASLTAERVGFEPTVRFRWYGGFFNGLLASERLRQRPAGVALDRGRDVFDDLFWGHFSER